MPQAITILVGTMTGTAELAAQEMDLVLQDCGFSPRILMMDGLDADVFRQGGVFLVVSSTYGNGDVPDNAQAFVASLRASRPRLDHVIFGVAALGDSTYRATFCRGGLQFDGLLTDLGARRAGAPFLHDASSGDLAEDAAGAWVARWAREELTPALAA